MFYCLVLVKANVLFGIVIDRYHFIDERYKAQCIGSITSAFLTKAFPLSFQMESSSNNHLGSNRHFPCCGYYPPRTLQQLPAEKNKFHLYGRFTGLLGGKRRHILYTEIHQCCHGTVEILFLNMVSVCYPGE